MFRIIALFLIVGINHQVQCTQPATTTTFPDISVIEKNFKRLWTTITAANCYIPCIGLLTDRKFAITLVNYILSCPKELQQDELYSGFKLFFKRPILDVNMAHRNFKITLDESSNIFKVEAVENQANAIDPSYNVSAEAMGLSRSPIILQQMIDEKLQEVACINFPTFESLDELVTLHQFDNILRPNIDVNSYKYISYLSFILKESLPIFSTEASSTEIIPSFDIKDSYFLQILLTKEVAKEFEGINRYQFYCYLSKLLNEIKQNKHVDCATADIRSEFEAYIRENSITYKEMCAGARKFDSVNEGSLKKLREIYFKGKELMRIQPMEPKSNFMLAFKRIGEICSPQSVDDTNAVIKGLQNDLAKLHVLLFSPQNDLICKAFFYILACEDPLMKAISAVNLENNKNTEMLFFPEKLESLEIFLPKAVEHFKITKETTFKEFKKLYNEQADFALRLLAKKK